MSFALRVCDTAHCSKLFLQWHTFYQINIFIVSLKQIEKRLNCTFFGHITLSFLFHCNATFTSSFIRTQNHQVLSLHPLGTDLLECSHDTKQRWSYDVAATWFFMSNPATYQT